MRCVKDASNTIHRIQKAKTLCLEKELHNMIVYFSTVVRAAPQERGGELVKLDWDTKRVLACTPIVPANPSVLDRNSKG